MNKDARYTALKILLRCAKRTCTLDKSIDDAKNELECMSRQDRNLCNAIVFGVLRNRGYLDFIIRSFSKKSIERLDEPVLYILRIGLFQLVFLDRIPAFAAINTSIELAKNQTNIGAQGFINAVLRNAEKNRHTLALPDADKNGAAHICVHYSMPAWLTKRWVAAYGYEKSLSLCKAINTIPPITLRTNTLKINRNDLGALLETQEFNIGYTEQSPDGIYISNPGKPVNEIDGFDQGFFQVQDEAAQLVSQILAPKPLETILDACAGLGGKTCHLAQLMNNQGSIVAADMESHKLDSLGAECLRLGIKNIQVQQINLLTATLNDFSGYFDKVLLDAPCSGLGVMRRNPDTKWKQTLKDVLRMAAQQKKMLNSAANFVKPGGILVYAVCSCEPEENEQVIEAFLQKRKDYSLDTSFKTYPLAHHMDGFFVARLKRQEKTP
ncbi:MAG: 16S rRNA (cytosine(967)-C(5))-methyltransferase RsmB [Proteobacteria bacterium]|nr:16S rRNA (cytosine(967)-C(5))-methyltransferase RsmB [Desulfobacula sp.]MBU3954215.1 16S rRNA (cytosine(967)-C(5))-methyltransferase RsmB [Pseudomonadota bacterium]MBU4130121.1 16S rRNA (cytosine(967)-C(5))-methyltransferase RsmB [Pseudomonadota bacterium]